MKSWIAIVVAGALTLAACTGGGGDTTTTNAAAASITTETTSTTSVVSSTTVPPTSTTGTVEPGIAEVDPVLAEHATWFLAVLSTGELTEEDYEQRFSDTFKEQISYEALAPSLTPLVTEGWAVTEVLSEEPSRLIATIAPSGGEPELQLTVGVNADGVMQELSAVVAPVEELENPPQSLAQTQERLAEFGESTLLAAEVVDGSCEIIDATGGDSRIPLGSVFKLWVLAALADAIETGDVAWDDTLTVTEDIKSLPSGRLQDEEPGTEVTVEEAALGMISISDNTATDMIIDLLGRTTIEESLRGRMTNPRATLPFLTTREMFILKFGDESRLDGYIAADLPRRRAILEEIADAPLPSVGDLPPDPVAIHEVEWFATPRDLCGILTELGGRMDTAGLEPLREILTANPGVPDEGGVWDTIAFKGGAENGVVVGAWYVENGDRAFILVGSVTNEEEVFATDRPLLIMAAGRDLLAGD